MQQDRAGNNSQWIGDYRVVYVVLGSETRVVRIVHRREGYRWMLRMGH